MSLITSRSRSAEPIQLSSTTATSPAAAPKASRTKPASRGLNNRIAIGNPADRVGEVLGR